MARGASDSAASSLSPVNRTSAASSVVQKEGARAVAARLRGPDRVQRIAGWRRTGGATCVGVGGRLRVRCPAVVCRAVRIGRPGCVGAIADAFCSLGAAFRRRSGLLPRGSRSNRASCPFSGRPRRSRRGDRRRSEQRRQASHLIVCDCPHRRSAGADGVRRARACRGGRAARLSSRLRSRGRSCLLRRSHRRGASHDTRWCR